MDEIIRILKSVNDEIADNFKARIKGVFGSFARGEERPDSDLDVLVEFMEGATLLDFVGLALYLEERLGLPVDVMPIDTVRLELKHKILDEAIFV